MWTTAVHLIAAQKFLPEITRLCAWNVEHGVFCYKITCNWQVQVKKTDFSASSHWFGATEMLPLKGSSSAITTDFYALWYRSRDTSLLYCEVRGKTNKMQQLDVYYQHFINMFRASLCPSSGEKDVCYCTWCDVLVLLDVVGGVCGALRFRVRAVAT